MKQQSVVSSSAAKDGALVGSKSPAESPTKTLGDAEAWRLQRPAARPSLAFTPAPVAKFALKNGIPVYLVERHGVPTVLVRVIIRGGGVGSNSPNRPGMAEFLTTMLKEGTRRGGSIGLVDEAESLGTILASGSSNDESSWVSIDSLSDQLGASLDLLADAVLRPDLASTDFDRARERFLTDLRRQRDSAPRLAINAFRYATYGPNSPYGFSLPLVDKSVGTLTREETLKFYRDNWHAGNAAIVVVGDLTPQLARRELDKRFGRWRALASWQPRDQQGESRPGRVILIDRPSAKQANVVMGHLGPSRKSVDWLPAYLMTRALGGYYAARINQNIRVERGYTYAARTDLTPNIGPSLLAVLGAMALDKTVPAIREIIKEIEGMKTNPPGDDELNRAKAATTEGLANQFRTNQRLSSVLEDIPVFSLPIDYLSQRAARVRSLTSAEIAKISEKYLHPEQLNIVVVGPADRFEKELTEAGIGPIERWTPTGKLIQKSGAAQSARSR